MPLLDKPLIVMGIDLNSNKKITYREVNKKLGLGLGPELLEMKSRLSEWEDNNTIDSPSKDEILFGDRTVDIYASEYASTPPEGLEKLYKNVDSFMYYLAYYRSPVASHRPGYRRSALEWCVKQAFEHTGHPGELSPVDRANFIYDMGDPNFTLPNGKSLVGIFDEFTSKQKELCRAVCEENWAEIYGHDPKWFKGEPYGLVAPSSGLWNTAEAVPFMKGFAEKVPGFGIFKATSLKLGAARGMVDVWLVPKEAYIILTKAHNIRPLPIGLETLNFFTSKGFYKEVPKDVDTRAFVETFATLMKDSQVSFQEAFDMAAALER